MPTGGELWVETCNVDLKDDDLIAREIRGLKAGKYVCVSVKDNGLGMNSETVSRIFDPFFTTKETGTGLGLSFAYGTIRGCGGDIAVQSIEGSGTTFKIYLPVLERKIEVEAPAAQAGILKGHETVLVVDDERFILDIAAEYLSILGYKTRKAGNGREALQMYAETQDEIDLLILDMIMPGMSSEEFIKQISGINPDVKILLSSGYYFADRIYRILAESRYEFIQKPYTLETLSQKVREVLEGTKRKTVLSRTEPSVLRAEAAMQ
jgi:two-component system cell cycle sensor histidine kinase/response regulator CckA